MEMSSYGTGAVEIKSGYGLTTETELKMLRVIRRLKEETPFIIKSNFWERMQFLWNIKADKPSMWI